MSLFANTPAPPYYSVIFSSLRSGSSDGYDDAAQRMLQLAADQPGFLGVESAHEVSSGFGITVSYWNSLEAIQRWREDSEHQTAQKKGQTQWYDTYRVRVARVERSYGFGEAQ